MSGRIFGKQLNAFQIIIGGFGAIILLGAGLLMLPFSSPTGRWTGVEDALFTATSAVCVTGLVVRDTATCWSLFGQAVILMLIQIGGLGIATVTALIATVSGRKISLLQRNMLQESISAHQMGGILKLTRLICKLALAAELLGALLMLPAFLSLYGRSGAWMALFHSVSAFCNAGFDVMGARTGAFSSLTFFRGSVGVALPVCLLIVFGGIGFLTWDDFAANRLRFRKYRMQSKAILSVTAALILIPALVLFFSDFSAFPLKERLCMSFFQAITPRTAGFNTAELPAMSGAARAMMIVLMLIGGSPGSTAGGMKTTTAAVLLANALAVFRRKKHARLFGRRIEDGVVKNAAALLVLYMTLVLTGALVISAAEALPVGACLFETASAIGTVGLSMGITPGLGTLSRLILIGLMFFGRVGGLTLIFAAVSPGSTEVSLCPVEKITVG